MAGEAAMERCAFDSRYDVHAILSKTTISLMTDLCIKTNDSKMKSKLYYQRKDHSWMDV